MTDCTVDLENLRRSLRSMSRGDLLVIAQRAVELVPNARLPALLGDRVQMDAPVDMATEVTSSPRVTGLARHQGQRHRCDHA